MKLTGALSAALIPLILACSTLAGVLENGDGSSLSIVVKRDTENEATEATVSEGTTAAASAEPSTSEATTSEPMAVALDAPTEGSLLDIFSSSSKEKKPARAIIQNMHVVSNVTFRYAKTRIQSKILNPADVAQEVFFNVIIPENAFISGFAMEIDGTVYNAYVKEKEEAQKVYEAAVKRGVAAGHVKQSARDSNRFSVSVNVEPQKKVRFNLTYEELLERKYGYYRHVINLNPGQIVQDLIVNIIVSENRNITKFRIPEFQSGNEAYPVSQTREFDLAVTERVSPTEVRVSFKPSEEDQKKLRHRVIGFVDPNSEELMGGMSGQFAVEYDVDRDPSGGEVLVNDGYFVHFFAPPDLPPLKKHIVFVLDVSGSMDGRKIEQLKQAMNGILSELNPDDYFNIIEFAFSVTVRDLDAPMMTPEDNPWLVQQGHNPVNLTTKLVKPFPATPDYIQKGKEVVSKMTAAGGTNIYGALDVAIDLAKLGLSGVKTSSTKEENSSGKAPEPMIIFLTDGEPTVGETSDSKILRNVDEKNDPRIPIFSLAFGTDADFPLLKKVSLLSNGFARQIYEAADTSIQLRNFYKQISSPVLSKVKFLYPPEQVKNETITKVNFANFYGGSELVVSGKLQDDSISSNEIGLVEAESEAGLQNYTVTHIDCPPAVLKAERDYRPLERLWVYMTIKQLLNEAELMKARSYLIDYKQTSPKPLELDPKEKALRLALEYSFVCPLTSLVVVKPGSLSDAEVEPAVSRPGPVHLQGAQPLTAQKFYSLPAVAMQLRYGMGQSSISRLGMAGPNGFAAAAPGEAPAIFTTSVSRGKRPSFSAASIGVAPPGGLSFAEYPTTEASTSERPLLTLDAITWLDKITTAAAANESTATEEKDDATPTSPSLILGRNQTNEVFGECAVLGRNGTGECRHLEYCVLEEIVNDMDLYLSSYYCPIPGNFYGICCPVA